MSQPTPGFSPAVGATAPPWRAQPPPRNAAAGRVAIDAAAVTDLDAPAVVRMPDGRIVERHMPPATQRMMHLSLLHARTRGYIELGAGKRVDGKLQIYTRRQADHFLRGGASGDPEWLTRMLALAAVHDQHDDELFIGVTPRSQPAASKQNVLYTRFLWLDVDGAEHLDRLWALLERYPATAIIDSAGSGGRHAYWRLDRLVPARVLTVGERTAINPINVVARTVEERTGRRRTRVVGYRDRASGVLLDSDERPVELIERYNTRLIHQLGTRANERGDPVPVGDPMCAEHARLMRWAGSPNHKTGRPARILTLDLYGRGYAPEELVGALPDPPGRPVGRRRTREREIRGRDPYKSIPAEDYFWRLARIEVPDDGWVSCPSPEHPDISPSCSVGDYRWRCFSCGHRGGIYDLASVLAHGPSGDALAGSREDFLRAVAAVRDEYGERR
jgi:hypothetical protein